MKSIVGKKSTVKLRWSLAGEKAWGKCIGYSLMREKIPRSTEEFCGEILRQQFEQEDSQFKDTNRGFI